MFEYVLREEFRGACKELSLLQRRRQTENKNKVKRRRRRKRGNMRNCRLAHDPADGVVVVLVTRTCVREKKMEGTAQRIRE